MAFQWGKRSQKPKFLKESVKLDWNFQRGGILILKAKKKEETSVIRGVGEGYGYFWEQHT